MTYVLRAFIWGYWFLFTPLSESEKEFLVNTEQQQTTRLVNYSLPHFTTKFFLSIDVIITLQKHLIWTVCTFRNGIPTCSRHICAQLYKHVCVYCKHFVILVSLPRGAQILCFFHYNCQKIYYIIVVVACTNISCKAHKRCFW